MDNNVIQFQSTSNPPPEVGWTQCALDFKWINVNVTNRIESAFDAHRGVHVSGLY